MKKLLLILFITSSTQLASQSFFETADEFFEQFVVDGMVRYDQLSKERTALNKLVLGIEKFDLKSASDSEKKAYYINAYNILVIHHIMANYPTEGPLKIEGFFDQLKANVAGEYLTLNELEKGRLFQAFPDERLHFVLVCAAIGCPPLANYAYRPETIENQLTERTNYVLNFPAFIRVNKNIVQISKIFEWYEGDFLAKSESVLSYIDQYHTQSLAGKRWSYYEYDWTLNKY